MLDSQILKNNIEEFNENLKKRDIDVDTNLLIELNLVKEAWKKYGPNMDIKAKNFNKLY